MSSPAKRWRVYILKCSDGSLYTGATNDLERRLAVHLSGKGAAYTRSRLPVRLVFFEEAPDRSGALRREAALKRLTRKQKLAFLRLARTARNERKPRSPRARRGALRPEAARGSRT